MRQEFETELYFFQKCHVVRTTVFSKLVGINMVRDFILDAMHLIDGGVLKDLLTRIDLQITACGGPVLRERMDAYVSCKLMTFIIMLMLDGFS